MPKHQTLETPLGTLTATVSSNGRILYRLNGKFASNETVERAWALAQLKKGHKADVKMMVGALGRQVPKKLPKGPKRSQYCGKATGTARSYPANTPGRVLTCIAYAKKYKPKGWQNVVKCCQSKALQNGWVIKLGSDVKIRRYPKKFLKAHPTAEVMTSLRGHGYVKPRGGYYKGGCGGGPTYYTGGMNQSYKNIGGIIVPARPKGGYYMGGCGMMPSQGYSTGGAMRCGMGSRPISYPTGRTYPVHKVGSVKSYYKGGCNRLV